jgi:hypothetical protein
MALSLVDTTLYSCSADGVLQVRVVVRCSSAKGHLYYKKAWNEGFENVADWKGHVGITHSSFPIIGRGEVASLLMTGGSDGNIKVRPATMTEICKLRVDSFGSCRTPHTSKVRPKILEIFTVRMVNPNA